MLMNNMNEMGLIFFVIHRIKIENGRCFVAAILFFSFYDKKVTDQKLHFTIYLYSF